MKRKTSPIFSGVWGRIHLSGASFHWATVTKLKVRDYLREKGYEAKSKEGESMEVCFIKGDYRDFLRDQCPELDAEIGPGWFVNSEGRKTRTAQRFSLLYHRAAQRTGNCTWQACLCVEDKSAEKYGHAWRARTVACRIYVDGAETISSMSRSFLPANS